MNRTRIARKLRLLRNSSDPLCIFLYRLIRAEIREGWKAYREGRDCQPYYKFGKFCE